MKNLMIGVSGVRGVVGETLTPELLTRLGAAYLFAKTPVALAEESAIQLLLRILTGGKLVARINLRQFFLPDLLCRA